MHKYRPWWFAYKNTLTCTQEAEERLIAHTCLSTGSTGPSFFQPQEDVKLDRVSRRVLQCAFGRIDLVRVLCVIERLDELLSRVAQIPAALVAVHANLYGKTEFAHVPRDAQYPFMSFNIANDRVRSIFQGVFWNDSNSIVALVDLVVHEKAHTFCFTRDINHDGHDNKFYDNKNRLKEALILALQANKNVNPFRHIHRQPSAMASASQIALRLPWKVMRDADR